MYPQIGVYGPQNKGHLGSNRGYMEGLGRDPRLWEVWYIPHYGECRIYVINRISMKPDAAQSLDPKTPGSVNPKAMRRRNRSTNDCTNNTNINNDNPKP